MRKYLIHEYFPNIPYQALDSSLIGLEGHISCHKLKFSTLILTKKGERPGESVKKWKEKEQKEEKWKEKEQKEEKKQIKKLPNKYIRNQLIS